MNCTNDIQSSRSISYRTRRKLRASLFQLLSQRSKQPLRPFCIWLKQGKEINVNFLGNVPKKKRTSLQHAMSLSINMVWPFCDVSRSLRSCTFFMYKPQIRWREWTKKTGRCIPLLLLYPHEPSLLLQAAFAPRLERGKAELQAL
jgi:hypothetical protein